MRLMVKEENPKPSEPHRAGTRMKQGRHQRAKFQALTLRVVQMQGRSWCPGTDHVVN